jgi:hypothetical protein
MSDYTVGTLADLVEAEPEPSKPYHPCPECPSTTKHMVQIAGGVATYACGNRHTWREDEACQWCRERPSKTINGYHVCATCAEDYDE